MHEVRASKKIKTTCSTFINEPHPYEAANEYLKKYEAQYLDKDGDGEACESLRRLK